MSFHPDDVLLSHSTKYTRHNLAILNKDIDTIFHLLFHPLHQREHCPRGIHWLLQKYNNTDGGKELRNRVLCWWSDQSNKVAAKLQISCVTFWRLNQTQTCLIFNLSRGVLPENLRRGPYAVVERAERANKTTLSNNSAPIFTHFLNPSIRIHYSATFHSFLVP